MKYRVAVPTTIEVAIVVEAEDEYEAIDMASNLDFTVNIEANPVTYGMRCYIDDPKYDQMRVCERN